MAKFSLIIIFLICSFNLFSQLQRTNEGYRLNSIDYKANSEILQLLTPVAIAKMHYRRSIVEKRLANTFGIISIASLATIPIFISQIKNSSSGSPNLNMLGWSFLSAFFGSVNGMIGIAFFSMSNNRRNNKVPNLYNNFMFSLNSNTPETNLEFKVIENRIGLVYSF